ncbi:MAG: hypothetical protein GY711_24185 [bacterium]|nr:hypothetical protein [bacterium]
MSRVPEPRDAYNRTASSGFICLSGNIDRVNAPEAVGIGPCITLRLDLSALPVNPPQASESWNFQCWYRDGATNNFTDGVTVTLI